MQLIEGQTLRAYPSTSLDETLTIARQICAALEHAHAAGMAHGFWAREHPMTV